MSVLVVGLSYRSAPVALLERVSVAPADLPKQLHGLLDGTHVQEALVLSTCNRVEVYADVDKFHGGVQEVTELLARHASADLGRLGKHLYVHYEDAAVQHVFAVAAGLDSMVVGETQVLGQLRTAYAAAREEGAVGRVLHELLQQALRVGKRVHADTGIDRAGASLVGRAVELAGRALGDLSGRPALLVGAGSMGALAGATLRRAGIGPVVVANRTVETADRLAAALDGRGTGLSALADEIAAADLVVSSTGAFAHVVGVDDVATALTRRGGRPLVLVDLALPRDVDPAVAALPGVTLHDLDSLRDALSGDRVDAEVEAARQIVAAEVGDFLAAQRTLQVAPTVTALRSRADEVVRAELNRLDARLPDLDAPARAEVETAVRRVVDKLLHAPTVRVKQLAGAPGGDSYAAALRELFGLDPDATAAVSRASVAVEEQDELLPGERQ